MRYFYSILAVVVGTAFTGLLIPVFDADSALYAAIAKSLAQSGDYLNLYVHGSDWLDKPHFPFWLEAASMQVLGISAFAYKLPSFLFFLLALAYTYRLARSLYGTAVARISVILLGTAVHTLLGVNDVRAEAILTGLVIGGIYHLYRLTERNSLPHILLSAAFIGAAVMTKGIFVLIVFGSAIGGYLMAKGQWKVLLRWRWVAVALLSALFITPELYALYHQFDARPGTEVFGRTGVSGIRFFLWDSQFGRFANSGPIRGNGHPLYFLHTVLWAFAPWALVAYAALIQKTGELFKRRSGEYLTYFGTVVMFLIFSLSSFQLSHYISILFPFIAILSAHLIVDGINTRLLEKVYRWSLLTAVAAVPAVGILIQVIFLDKVRFYPVVLLCCAAGLAGFCWWKRREKYSLLNGAALSVCCLFLFLNSSFYPRLLDYQAGMQAANYLEKQPPPPSNYASIPDYLFEFYSDREVAVVRSAADLAGRFDAGQQVIVFADPVLRAAIQSQFAEVETIEEFQHFRVTKLNGTFFAKQTRHQALEERYLLRVTL